MEILQPLIIACSLIGLAAAVVIEVMRSRRINRLWRDHLRRLDLHSPV